MIQDKIENIKGVVETEVSLVVKKYKESLNLINDDSGELFDDLLNFYYSSIEAAPTTIFQSDCCYYSSELISFDPRERIELFEYLKNNNIH